MEFRQANVENIKMNTRSTQLEHTSIELHHTNVSKVVSLYNICSSFPKSSKLIAIAFISSLVYGLLLLDFPIVSFEIALYDMFLYGIIIFFLPIFISVLTSYFLLVSENIRHFQLPHLLSTGVICSLNLGVLLFLGRIFMFFFQFRNILISSFILGVASIVLLRFLAFKFLTQASFWYLPLHILIQPTISLMAFISLKLNYTNPFYVFIVFIAISIVLLIGLYFSLQKVSNSVKSIVGIEGDSLFHAFVKEWFGGESNDLESHLDRLGEVTSLPVTIILFRKNDNKNIKSILIVPSVHPGPFKNIGSSNLPYYLTTCLKEQFNCEVLVFHGPSTHAENLVSQRENEKVLSQIQNLITKDISFESSATPFVRVAGEGFQLGCQRFSDCTVLTATRSPKTMEDISLEVGLSLLDTIKRRFGVEATLIDAHNCLNSDAPYIVPDSLLANQLKKDAEKAIEKFQIQKNSRLRVGVHRIYPQDIGKEEGMGECGIAVLLFEVAGQKAAYVHCDSNNIQKGLREKILESIAEIDEIEVMTSDTHTVNALAPSGSGYHPLGEITDHHTIIEYIREVVIKANENLEEVEVGVIKGTLEDVKVMGDTGFETLLEGVTNGANMAKRSLPLILGALYLFSAVFLTLFF
jgi:putative membrane protein